MKPLLIAILLAASTFAAGQQQSADGAPASITKSSEAYNIVTLTANNTFKAGQYVLLDGLTRTKWLNGMALAILPAGLSATQFEVKDPTQHDYAKPSPETGGATLISAQTEPQPAQQPQAESDTPSINETLDYINSNVPDGTVVMLKGTVLSVYRVYPHIIVVRDTINLSQAQPARAGFFAPTMSCPRSLNQALPSDVTAAYECMLQLIGHNVNAAAPAQGNSETAVSIACKVGNCAKFETVTDWESLPAAPQDIDAAILANPSRGTLQDAVRIMLGGQSDQTKWMTSDVWPDIRIPDTSDSQPHLVNAFNHLVRLVQQQAAQSPF